MITKGRLLRTTCFPVFLSLGGLFAGDKTIVDLASEKVLQAASIKEVALKVEDGTLRMALAEGQAYPWPGFVSRVLPEAADVTGYGEISVELRNGSPFSVEIGVKLTSGGAGLKTAQEEKRFHIAPGVAMTYRYPIPPKKGGVDRPALFLMRGVPEWAVKAETKASTLDWGHLTEIAVHFVRPTAGALIYLKPFIARGIPTESARFPQKPFPIFDAFGQYRHGDWPGKIHSLAELTGGAAAEMVEYGAKPRPVDWNRYGGWSKGPSFPPTGFFYVTNLKARWWFVDPEGKLFFAHGMHGVRYGTATPVTEREFWFEKLPEATDAVVGSFWESYQAWGSWHYKEGLSVRAFNFTQANLRLKYGENWRKTFDELCTRRLPSWGMNTLGAGSSMSIPALGRMAYYIYVVPKAPVLKAAKGYWGNFYDVFDPGFAPAVKRALAAVAKDCDRDPWLLGVGVDNELTWGLPGGFSLAVSTLQCPGDQEGKKFFVEELRKKYGNIEDLNHVWGTGHASWEGLLSATTSPDPKKASVDLAAFHEKLISRYFQVCRDGVREIFPRHLYTGCRFASRMAEVEKIAHRYCDVVSHNHYKYDVGELTAPVADPRPLMVTEFHFNAPDRGYFSPAGLLEVPNQDVRAERYQAYLKSALEHPLVIGTFWFLYQHQPPSGRFDGENYSAGFVDCVDTPIREMVDASRKVGDAMYTARFGK